MANGPPPEVHTATRGSPGTWRASPLPRNCTTASWAKPKPVQAAGADLATEGIQRQFAIECNAFAALNKTPAFTDVAKSQCFQPGDRLEAETVVELRRIHIGRLCNRFDATDRHRWHNRPSTRPGPS